MATAKEIRHLDISNLEKGAFQAAYGHEDIRAFIQAVYTQADHLGVFRVICIDDDLNDYNIVREALRNAPQEPEAGATQTAIQAYEMQRRLFDKQDEGLRQLKKTLLAALDRTAIGKVAETTFGTIRLSVKTILTLLKTEFGTMTNKELISIQRDWRATRWEATTDLCDFMASFQEQVNFLTDHAYPPPEGEQVMTLMDAVRHEAAFHDMATTAFHTKYPDQVTQTLKNLIQVFTTVYRGQYERVTASEHHHTANQVKVADPHEDTMQFIAASARGSLEGRTVTHAQKMALGDAVAKAVMSILQPQPINPRNRTNKSAATKQDTPGACTHPDHHSSKITHSWTECRLNPNSANFTSK